MVHGPAEEPVYPISLDFLRSHGFTKEQASRALRRCGGSREKALAYLQGEQTGMPSSRTDDRKPDLTELQNALETRESLHELEKNFTSAEIMQVWHACGFNLPDAKAVLLKL